MIWTDYWKGLRALKLVHEQCIIIVYMDAEWNRFHSALYRKMAFGDTKIDVRALIYSRNASKNPHFSIRLKSFLGCYRYFIRCVYLYLWGILF